MKIAASQLSLQSSHSLTYREETQSSLQSWGGKEQIPPQRQIPTPSVSLSTTGKNLASGDALKSTSKHLNDALLEQLKTFIEQLTGKPVQIFSPEDAGLSGVSTVTEAASGQAPGFSYNYHQSVTEVESTQVDISGTVQTADGKTINLNLQLSMDRSWTENTDVSVQGGAKRKDPLVLNFNGTAAQLQDQQFLFDLNGDGSKENIAMLAPGNAYLAFDRNGNGKIDDGSELFGPTSGSGFSDLAALDSDGNGWIDENDPAFSKLSLWSPSASGNPSGGLQSLASKRVGALYVGGTDSHFELRGAHNAQLGNIAKTGLYLNEDGSGGALQEVDLTV